MEALLSTVGTEEDDEAIVEEEEYCNRREFEFHYGYERGRDRGNHYGSKPTFGPNDCYRCGIPGHLARNCYSRKLVDQ